MFPGRAHVLLCFFPLSSLPSPEPPYFAPSGPAWEEAGGSSWQFCFEGMDGGRIRGFGLEATWWCLDLEGSVTPGSLDSNL